MRPAVPVLGRVLLSGAEIDERVRAMGATIRRDYAGQVLHLVVVAEGGQVFGEALKGAIGPDVDVRMNIVHALSYGNATASPGQVRVHGVDQLDVAGGQVLLVDDIVDSGHTARTLLELLGGLGAASLRFAALLSKPDRRVVDVRVDYVGFKIPDEFVVGYGMDYAGAFRDLPAIHALAASR